MKFKHISILVLLCFLCVTQLRAQLSWARNYNISAAIPGAAWTDIQEVMKVSADRYIVAGTVTGTGAGSCVVARFSQDGVPGWVREIKGAPGAAITVYDIAESRNAANPGYIICGEYLQGGVTYNYLVRIDDLGNLLWDRYWQANARLVSVLFTAANQIVTVGEGITAQSVRSTTIYRFDNLGNSLASKIISTDPEIIPVDHLEDPLFNGGGFFILANYRNVGAANRQPYCIFVNNVFNVVQSYILNYPTVAPAPPFYQNVEAVRFEQDVVTRDLYILTNARGTGRSFRPSVLRYTPVAGGAGAAISVVLAPPFMPAADVYTGTDINLYNGDAGKGIMVTTVQQSGGSIRTYSWKLNSALNTVSLFEQWLAVSNVRNTSLCVSTDAQHYVLAGHDAGNNLTLNVVDLNGDKINNAGTSQCVNRNNWVDEHPKIQPNGSSYSTVNITVNPLSVSSDIQRSWWYDNACWCAEVPAQTFYRYAYPQIPYDNWELNINRATRSNNGNLYLANTLDLPIWDKTYLIELNAAGQHINTFTNIASNAEKDGRQFMRSATTGDLIAAYRTATGGGAPKTTFSRFAASGSPTMWTTEFPSAQTPGRLFMAEALNASADIIAVADIDGPDESSNTHDLMIARLSAGGTLIYYQEIPVLFNGMQRDNFRVLALEPTRDGGFAICGSTGYQNSDFIAGYVMKFSAAGTLMWQYEFRRQTPNPNNCYDLNGPHDCRSASMLFDLRQNGPNGYYVAGYTSDHDQNGQGASFWNGLVVHLDINGNELSVQEYNDINGRFTTFKGIAVTPTDIAVVGDLADPGGAGRTDLFVRIDKTNFGVIAAQSYAHDNNSSLLDVFNNGNGFTMSGSTTDWYGVLTPQVITADANGANGCEVAVDISTLTPVNDPVVLQLDLPVDHAPSGPIDEFGITCVEVFDICEAVSPAAMRQPTGLSDFGNLGKDRKDASEITVYPNPASTVLNLQVPQDVKVREIAIVDINGKVVYHSTAVMGNHAEINISELPEGMYAVKMETSTGKRFTRFVKL